MCFPLFSPKYKAGARFLIEISRSASKERPPNGNLFEQYERPVRGRLLGRDMTERSGGMSQNGEIDFLNLDA